MQFLLSLLLIGVTVSCSYGQLFACPDNYAPVCGSDGKTYPNKCHLEAAQHQNPSLVEVHYGPCHSASKRSTDDYYACPENSKQGICTDDYTPVCANDGKTYGNLCGMCAAMYDRQKSGENVILRVEHPGECGTMDYCFPWENNGVCNRLYIPVCASDGETYDNRCEYCYYKSEKQAKGEQISIEYIGECQRCPPESVYGDCTDDYSPVCASIGKNAPFVTYRNLCKMCAYFYSNYGFEANVPTKIKELGPCEDTWIWN